MACKWICGECSKRNKCNRDECSRCGALRHDVLRRSFIDPEVLEMAKAVAEAFASRDLKVGAKVSGKSA